MSDTRARAYLVTINNYSDEEYQAALDQKTNYTVIGKEVGKKCGVPHIHAYFYFKDAKTFSSLKKKFPRADIRACKGTAQDNFIYCSKDGDFVEIGKKPMSQEEKGQKGKEAIAARWELAKAGRFEELPPEQIKTYEYIYSKHLECKDRPELDNVWIYGQSGCGKSSFVRKEYPEFYIKPMSKWWDGYRGEEVVVLDDFDPSHVQYLSYYLKIWADHYAFNAEVKGGMLKIRPKKLIITSQYTMEQCFLDQKTLEAISRRFKLIEL